MGVDSHNELVEKGGEVEGVVFGDFLAQRLVDIGKNIVRLVIMGIQVRARGRFEIGGLVLSHVNRGADCLFHRGVRARVKGHIIERLVELEV